MDTCANEKICQKGITCYRRQVTYQADENQEIDEPTDHSSFRPATKKPLPLQVVYPGDLSSFYTTQSTDEYKNSISNNSSSKNLHKQNEAERNKRSLYPTSRRDGAKGRLHKAPFGDLPRTKSKHLAVQESRLHASYHKPSVSIMNDIPVEMSFDGAGFLRYEDDSDEVRSSHSPKRKNPASSQERSNQDNSQAIHDFRAAFNVSQSRMPTPIKYDDDVPYQNEPQSEKPFEEKIPDHGAQSTENGSPFAVDFMTAFQHGMFANNQNHPTQSTQISQQTAYDPFQFYQNMFNNPMSTNTMFTNPVSTNPMFTNPVSTNTMFTNPISTNTPNQQQESFLQNHRVPGLTNNNALLQNTMFTQAPQQTFPSLNPSYIQNANVPETQKKQRRKRSVSHSANENGNIAMDASRISEDRYRYSKDDRQNAESGFLPITGTFNGGAIQLNFPFYSPSPISPPIHSVSPYSMPYNSEGRVYRNPSEGFYYPSEARRYSYGVLGSGNFEVIRGGVYPNERPQQNYHSGYQDSRAPYISNYNPNYGTTEIILDGPIQGFQGFDNFNIQLINALSKQTESAVRPNHRDREELAT